MKKSIATGLIALMLTSPFSMAIAKGHGAHEMGMKIYRKLDLSEEQREQIREIYKKDGAKLKGMSKEEHDAMRQERQAFLENPNFDEAKAQAMIKARSERQQAHQLERLRKEHQAYQVLTPEQRTKMQELKKARMEKMKERMKEKAKDMQDKS